MASPHGESRLAVGVAASLLLHAALLLRPQVTTQKHRQPATLTLTLRPAAAGIVPRGTIPRITAGAAPRVPPPRAGATLRPRAAGVASTAEAVRSAQAAQPAEAAQPPTAGIDIDAARAQAREFALSSARQLPGNAQPTRIPTGDETVERPLIDALSRRIGRPLQVASEKRFNDGSRLIRFVGNVCLTIPRELSWARENAIGPTFLLPSNCPD